MAQSQVHSDPIHSILPSPDATRTMKRASISTAAGAHKKSKKSKSIALFNINLPSKTGAEDLSGVQVR